MRENDMEANWNGVGTGARSLQIKVKSFQYSNKQKLKLNGDDDQCQNSHPDYFFHSRLQWKQIFSTSIPLMAE